MLDLARCCLNVLKIVFQIPFKLLRLNRRSSDMFYHRKINLITQLDFLIDTLSMNKLDLMYLENLKMPMTSDQKVYFLQQIDRINSSIKILLWLRENVCRNEKLWTKFLNWTKL